MKLIDKQKEIIKIEWKIKALVLKAKWQKLSIIESITLAMQVVALSRRAYIVVSQPIPKHPSGIANICIIDRPEVIVSKKGVKYTLKNK